MVKYKPYNVTNGKEKSVKNEEGDVYAGDYVENLIKKDNKCVNIGFYDDPIRGEDEIASIPIDVLRRHIYITGKPGYGKSLLLKTLVSQIHFKTDKNYLILDSRGDLSMSLQDKIDDLNYIGSNGDYSLGLAEKEIPVFKSIYNEFFEMQDKNDTKFIKKMDEEVDSNNYEELIFETEEYNELFSQDLSSDKRVRRVLKKFREIDMEVYDILFGKDNLKEELFEENFVANINVEYESKKIFFDFLVKYIMQNRRDQDDIENNFVFLNDMLDFISTDTRGNLFSKGRGLGMSLIVCDQHLKDNVIANCNNIITFSYDSSPEAPKLAQIYNSYSSKYTISEDKIRNLSTSECIMRPVTKDGNVSNIPFVVEIFPPLKPELL